MINFHLAGLQFKVLCMLESTSPFDEYSFISDFSFSVLPHIKTHGYFYIHVNVYNIQTFFLKFLYKTCLASCTLWTSCLANSKSFISCWAGVVCLLLTSIGWLNLSIKINWSKSDNTCTVKHWKFLNIWTLLKDFFFVTMELNTLEQQCLLNTRILYKNRPYRKFQFFLTWNNGLHPIWLCHPENNNNCDLLTIITNWIYEM